MMNQRCCLSLCRLHLHRHCRMLSTTSKPLPIHPGIKISNIMIVDNPTRWINAIKYIAAEKVVGFDTESKPVYASNTNSFYQQTSPHVIQIATRRKTFLFSTLDTFNNKNMVTNYLGPILENKNILKVGFDLKRDEKLLRENYGINCNCLDLAWALPNPKKTPMSLRSAVEEYLQASFSKPRKLSLSNWGQPIRTFNENMLLYAANDAYLSILVYKAWIARNKSKPSIEGSAATSSSNQLPSLSTKTTNSTRTKKIENEDDEEESSYSSSRLSPYIEREEEKAKKFVRFHLHNFLESK